MSRTPLQSVPRYYATSLALALATAGTVFSVSTFAQAWPAKPIRFIVPFAAGGVADVVTRAVTPRLSEALGQPIIIDNRGGAGGTLGTSIGARAAPDGYTFVTPAASHVTTPSLYTKLDFDPVKDFAAVTKIADVPYLLVVPVSSPIRTLADFIATAKANPGKLAYGSAGNGSSNHLAGELLAGRIGASLLHVPYKGSAPALVDVLSGQISFMFDTVNTSTRYIPARLRAIGIGTAKRSTLIPDVPPIADTLPGFEAVTWVGLLAPAGTPGAIVSRMHAEIATVVAAPDVRERFSTSGAEPVASTPAHFAAYLAAEVKQWAGVVKQAKIPPVE
ncbi:MAG: tripartite tricarboxylate transporter substrate binding protein [Proteobacteria bacterium]|nr:tripartite tricarboxylate transporter substrate binding protein [Pseudomonadota bacterium]